MRKKIVAGNWKMNNTLEEGYLLVDEILKLDAALAGKGVLKVIATPFIHLAAVAQKLKAHPDFEAAAQNCHQLNEGAFTGEISAKMIASTGSNYVLIGHSERRHYFNETNAILALKVNVALENKLSPIFCIGENLEERNKNQHFELVQVQLNESLFHLSAEEFSNITIAYEPIWAIGTGNTASTQQVQEIHKHIRKVVEQKYGKELATNLSILYGGSCNANNAGELFSCEDVDGGLIGGASLQAKDFIAITNAY